MRRGKRSFHENLDVDGWIILKLILDKYSVRVWAGFNWLTIGPVAGCFKYSNELRVSKRAGTI
jgi:hypothetical protein